MTSIMWKSTDFLRHVVVEVEEQGTITFTYACEDCIMVLAEAFLRWVTSNHGGKKNHYRMGGLWCDSCGKSYDWRKANRLLTLQVGDMAQDQIVFLACAVQPESARI